MLRKTVNTMKSCQESSQMQLLVSFQRTFTSIPLDEHTTVLHSPSNSFLLKTLPKLSDTALQQIKDTLDLHESLNSSLFLPLLHYEFTPDADLSHNTLHAVYRYATHSLRDQIDRRNDLEQTFALEELWKILISVVQAFNYLFNKGISYGVLDCTRIFLEETVLLIDPSSVGVDPYDPQSLTLCSPEVLLQKEDIDIYKSDLYVLGLCILETALMTKFDSKEIQIQMCLRDLETMYEDEDFVELISAMLEKDSEKRISLEELAKVLKNKFPQDFSSLPLQPNYQDREEEINQIVEMDCKEVEKCDVKVGCEEEDQNQQNQMQKGKQKCNKIVNNTSVQQKIHKQTSKQIKNRLVTKRPSAENIFDSYYYKTQQSLYTDPKLLSIIHNSLMRHSQTSHEKENKHRNLNPFKI